MWLGGNKLTSVPAEIGQLTSLKDLYLYNNHLTSLRAEIGQLTLLQDLGWGNQLTSVPAEIGQLMALRELWLGGNQLTSVPASRAAHGDDKNLYLSYNQLARLAGGDRAAHVATGVKPLEQQLTSLPAEIGQLTSRCRGLEDNDLTSLPAAIRELRAAGCNVLDDGRPTVDE